MNKRLGAAAIAAGMLVASVPAVVAVSSTATAAPSDKSFACKKRTNNTMKKLQQCVTLKGVRRHQAALQAIADGTDAGNRAAGTPGYDQSVDYVARTLRRAGYRVRLDPFEFTFQAPATLRQTEPVQEDYETGAYTGSGAGEFEGDVIGVDLALGNADWPADPAESTSGCEAEDFDGIDFGGDDDIALIQRGACAFADKAVNAQAAGAEGVIIFNQGNAPERTGLIVGTLGDTTVDIPVVGASYDQGVALSERGARAFVDVDPPETRTNYNVLAELKGRKRNKVIMAGAHLDSVEAGPGINDNGSGSAAILETAVQMRKVKPRHTVRFAWWGAEELGLVGSDEYVEGLSEFQRKRIKLYLNFDMIGSPNHVFFIYDGDDSDGVGEGPGPEGSAQIERFYERFYEKKGLPYTGTDFSGRSDYGPFIEVGIPAGGLFTGAEGIKTEEQAETWGGTAGEQYDPCYHLACDTFDNNNNLALDVNSDAVASSVLKFGKNLKAITGRPVNPKKAKAVHVEPHTHTHKPVR